MFEDTGYRGWIFTTGNIRGTFSPHMNGGTVLGLYNQNNKESNDSRLIHGPSRNLGYLCYH